MQYLTAYGALGKYAFGKMKTYRDGVIHARHINASTGIGVKVDRKGGAFDWLIRKDALTRRMLS
jgi:hypothetical protein